MHMAKLGRTFNRPSPKRGVSHRSGSLPRTDEFKEVCELNRMIPKVRKRGRTRRIRRDREYYELMKQEAGLSDW